MSRVKGCINKKCVANKDKITYKLGYDYCTKCGDKLYYVCEKCYMKLPDDSKKCCDRCLAEKQDKNDRLLKIVGSVVIGITTLGIFNRKIKK